MTKTNHHIFFWLIVFALLNLLFGSKWGSYVESFYFTSMLFPIAIGTAYFFNNWLVPRFLTKGKLVRFVIYSVYTLIISVFLSQIVIILSLVLLADFKWHELDPLVRDLSQLELVIYSIVFLFGFVQVYQTNLTQKETLKEMKEQAKVNLEDTLTVRSNRRQVSLRLNELDYIESLSDYVKIWKGEQPIITREKISHLEKKLTGRFVRCHRSYLVNANKIDSIAYDHLIIKDQEIPIGRKYKPQIDTLMNGKK